jgi:GNAT superfamily N-acetyltransferase
MKGRGHDAAKKRFSGLKIRHYRPGDRPFVVHSLVESQRYISSVDSFSLCVLGKRYGERMIDALISGCEDDACILIAEIRRERVGMISASVHTPSVLEEIEMDSIKRGVITELFVEADYRGKGIAARLIAGAERWLKSRGCRLSVLSVLSGNGRARSLYSRLGYSEYELVMMKSIR